ncbi:hypothetical protein [Methanoculleus bourgensis]|jgi:hypothetical protein|nr:hypothetical protein [Methanoculleus bourgensis]
MWVIRTPDLFATLFATVVAAAVAAIIRRQRGGITGVNRQQ